MWEEERDASCLSTGRNSNRFVSSLILARRELGKGEGEEGGRSDDDGEEKAGEGKERGEAGRKL
jgi:hypothetical protein